MAGFGANVGIVGFDKLAASLDELAASLEKLAGTLAPRQDSRQVQQDSRQVQTSLAGAFEGIVGFDKLAASLDKLAGTLGKTADTFRQAWMPLAVLLLALIALLPLSSDDPACLLSPPAHRAITALLAFTIACSASCLVGCLVPVRMLVLIALLHLHSSGLGEGGGGDGDGGGGGGGGGDGDGGLGVGGGEGEGGGDFAWLLPLEIVALVGIVGPLVPPPVLQNLEYVVARFRRALTPPHPLPARQVQPRDAPSLRHTIVRPPLLPVHL